MGAGAVLINVGRDKVTATTKLQKGQFQSTRPAWGATPQQSILPFRFTCFNPRAPRGARRGQSEGKQRHSGFNPRAPRGARLGCIRYALAE